MLVMKKYRQLTPNIIEAVQFKGGNGEEIINLLDVRGKTYETIVRTFNEDKSEMITRMIATLEVENGVEVCKMFEGDYVVKNADGELYAIDKATFCSDFEEIE